YYAPRSRFVAGFVGESNFVDGRVVGIAAGRAAVEIAANHRVSVALRGAVPEVGKPVTLLLRPEHIRVMPADASGIAATVSALAFGGYSLRLGLQAGALP